MFYGSKISSPLRERMKVRGICSFVLLNSTRAARENGAIKIEQILSLTPALSRKRAREKYEQYRIYTELLSRYNALIYL